MTQVDPRAPVIVGAGQVTDHSEELSPLELMAEATSRAAADSGADGLLDGLGSIHAVDILSWQATDPGRALAAHMGLKDVGTTIRSVLGGSGPLVLLADLCSLIQAGDLDSGLIVGTEAVNPLKRAAAEGSTTGWPDPPKEEPDRYVG